MMVKVKYNVGDKAKRANSDKQGEITDARFSQDGAETVEYKITYSDKSFDWVTSSEIELIS